MSYFHIVTLTRFYLRIGAIFFMLSAFSCSVSGMEFKELFEFRCTPCASQKFKDYCNDAMGRRTTRSELRGRLFEFAKEGEISAVDTILENIKDNSLEGQEAVLREVASKKSPYACNLLASLLAEQEKPECLEWLKLCDENSMVEDIAFKANYACAILNLKESLNVEDLKQVWELLKAWRKVTKTDLDLASAAGGLYLSLTKAAVKIEAIDFICDLYTWAISEEDDSPVVGGIIHSIRGTRFLDIAIDKTNHIPVSTYKRANDFRIYSGSEDVTAKLRDMHQRKLYLSNEDNKQIVKGIVSHNLKAMLNDPAVKNIPLSPENSQYFAGFRENEPTEKHLKAWATLIVNKHRSKLIAVSDQNLALQDMANGVKNVELLENVIAGLKEIYGYEERQAA